MKIFKIAAIVFAIGFLLQVYAKINLQVSYKYEVDLMETHIRFDATLSQKAKNERFKEIEQRKQEIAQQQRQTEILFWTFLTGLILMVCIMFYKWSHRKGETLG